MAAAAAVAVAGVAEMLRPAAAGLPGTPRLLGLLCPVCAAPTGRPFWPSLAARGASARASVPL